MPNFDFGPATKDAILAAVHQCAQGNITKDELLVQLQQTTGGDYKDHVDEDNRGFIIKDGKRLITFYVAMDEDYEFEAAADLGVVCDNLSGLHRIVECTTWMARPVPQQVNIAIPDNIKEDELIIGTMET